MKKFKISLLALAVVFAIGSAFTTKSTTFTDYFRVNSSDCVQTTCSPDNPPIDECTFTVYEVDLGTDCSTPVLVPTYLPIQ